MIAGPLVEVRCAVCAGKAQEVICPTAEVRAHREYLRWFHRRRLRPGAAAGALEERAYFTQDYATDIVACRGCGLVFRSPRPTAAAIAQAYASDQYGHRRLEGLFASQLQMYRAKARFLTSFVGFTQRSERCPWDRIPERD